VSILHAPGQMHTHRLPGRLFLFWEASAGKQGRSQSGPAAPPRRQIVGQFPPASVVKVLLLENHPLTAMDGAP
jgi:hypothetical protein